MIVLALAVFEFSSFFYTREGMMMIWQIQSWSTILAYAFVAVDFGSVARLFTSDDMEKINEETNFMLMAAWLVTAAGDTFMTYLVIAQQMIGTANNIMVTSGTVSYDVYTKLIPALIAIFCWVIQAALVISLNKIVDGMLRSKREAKAQVKTEARAV
jgi:hypothetical protein